MVTRETQRFLYRAHAVGLAATFQKPYVESIPALASTALAITGGVAVAREEYFKYREILSFCSAETHLVGNAGSEPGVHTTLTTTTIEGLNIMNVLMADRIVLRMSSRHFMDDTEASLTFVGSHIENLRIGGHPVDISYDAGVLADWDTFSKARDGFAKRFPNKKDPGATLPMSIVSAVSAPPGVTAEGNRLDFPEFGSVYLGEVFVKEGQRRITLMRVALGCAVKGDVTIADGDGNGQPINP
jgi:hypothetical protein